MALLAPIVPIDMIDWIPPETARVFCFADIAAENTPYLNKFNDFQGKVVLDNQIYEGSEPATPEAFSAIVNAIEPALIILPDDREGLYETLRMADMYLPRIQNEYLDRVAGVLQGKNLTELDLCARYFTEHFGLKRLAIPVRNPIRKLSRYEVFTQLGCKRMEVKWHFLGMDYPYWDEIRLSPFVESMDTAEATSAALRDVTLEEGPHPRTPNFMNIVGEHRWQTKDLMQKNIRLLQDLIATPAESADLEIAHAEALSS